MRASLHSLLFVLLAGCASSLSAQQKNVPLNRQLMLAAERSMNTIFVPDTNKKTEPYTLTADDHATTTHTSFRPLIESRSFTIHQLCGCGGWNDEHNFNGRKLLTLDDIGWWRMKKKDCYENLITVRDSTDKFFMTIDPLFDLRFGKDRLDSLNEKLFNNTRGLLVRGDIGSQFSFETSFYENQSTLPAYLDNFAITRKVIPGQGRWKRFKDTGYDYAMASGYLSYSPGRHLNVQVGHGKHFIGDGYRSLLLSDNSFNYPYIRITTSFGKFQYTNLYAVFMNLSSAPSPSGTEPLFQKKAASFKFLSWNVHKRVQFGLFEGLIWQAAGQHNQQTIDISYANPVIFGSALQYGLDGAHNVVLGSTLKIKLSSKWQLYGQYVMDDLAPGSSLRNKSGFQAGMRYFDLFRIKDLHAQFEYDQVRPYTYAARNSAQNYAHYNQPLAHPLGANFTEAILLLDYRYKGFFTSFRFHYAVVGKDTSGVNLGSNIFASTNTALFGPQSDNNLLTQGLHTSIAREEFEIGYVFNPATNFNAVLGISNRSVNTPFNDSACRWIYIGIRTSLTNIYYDF